MRLRRLEDKDAPFMLEWMHDPTVVEHMQADFASKSIYDCTQFIQNSSTDNSTHFAIVDDNDEYMGTVSLKHITDTEAEFAITVRKSAMGKGFSSLAMREIIDYGFKALKLNSVYWCVNPENKRAVRFYDKNGYQRVDSPEKFGGVLTRTDSEVYLVSGIKNSRRDCGKLNIISNTFLPIKTGRYARYE